MLPDGRFIPLVEHNKLFYLVYLGRDNNYKYVDHFDVANANNEIVASEKPVTTLL